jgi:hypothetical protein
MVDLLECLLVKVVFFKVPFLRVDFMILAAGVSAKQGPELKSTEFKNPKKSNLKHLFNLNPF